MSAVRREELEENMLLQKALYVEPLDYDVDLKKKPANAQEYIHQVRKEHASYFPEDMKDPEGPPVCCPKVITIAYPMSLQQWKNNQASVFSKLSIELATRKGNLMKKFPQRSCLPIKERDWCLFCLGSDTFRKIYTDENPKDTKATYPFLSIVLHLEQKQIVSVLEYMKSWVNTIGFDHHICKWVYALLACLSKPVDDDCEYFLEDMYDDFLKMSKICNDFEENQYHLILAILKNYFCVKAYLMGPDLDQFVKLC